MNTDGRGTGRGPLQSSGLTGAVSHDMSSI